jgi:hypothetical protein
VVDYFSGKVWARAISNRFNGLTEEEQEKNDEERAYVPESGEEEPAKDPEEEKEAEPENPPGNVEAPEIVEERAPEPAAGRGQRQKKASAKVRGEGLVGGAGKYLKGAEKGKKKIHKSLTNRKYQKHLKALTTKLMNKRAKEGNPISEEDARAIVMEQERTRPEEAVQKRKELRRSEKTFHRHLAINGHPTHSQAPLKVYWKKPKPFPGLSKWTTSLIAEASKNYAIARE